MAREPYELISDPDKTTITASGGIALGYGAGPGLANAIFWNRIGSLFSCYRPAVALLSVLATQDLRQPLPLRRGKTNWHPNHAQAEYSAPGLWVSEDRYASRCGLHCRLKLKSTRKKQQRFVLFFHGSVEQWPFFDYPRVGAALCASPRAGAEHGPYPETSNTQQENPPPKVHCVIDPARREVTLTQPHPHHGLPQMVNSIQRVWIELPGAARQPLASCGFGQNEGDLRALWQDHGALESLRIRLGQVGGRYVVNKRVGAAPCGGPRAGAGPGPYPGTISFSHPHPLYYFSVVLELEPGAEREVILRTDYHTDDEGGDLRSKSEQQRRYPRLDAELKREAAAWRKYLSAGVPQFDCDDAALVRYWYYVWYVLRANRTAPGRHITHAFTAPSKYMYWGPWIWDGYFHVLGEMWLQDRQVAQDSIRAVLDMQFPNGFIPVCSGANYRMCFHEDIPGYRNPQGGGFASYVEPELAGYRELEHPFEAKVSVGATHASPAGDPWAARTFIHNEKTQTPLITCALEEYCSLYADQDAATELLPQIRRFDEWIARRRLDKQNRFILWHGDESGWDNATRHYPVPAKPFDVQAHFAKHRYSIEQLDFWDKNSFEYRWADDLDNHLLAAYALDSYWCRRDKWNYDFVALGDGQKSGKRRRQITPAAFMECEFAEKKSVDAWINALNHNQVFNTPYPIPTLARCDPDYAPHGWGWNGPVWLQVNYFAITGLLLKGQFDEAYRLWEKTRSLIIRDGQPYSYELYDPEMGTGMGCPDYSWQAMINHLIIRWFAGVNSTWIKPHLPPGIDRLSVTNLPGFVKEIHWERLQKQFNLTISVRRKFFVTKNQRVWRLRLDSLGEVESVSCNGSELEPPPKNRDSTWKLPGSLLTSKDWEIIIKCR